MFPKVPHQAYKFRIPKVSDHGCTSTFKDSTQRFQIQIEHKGSKFSEKITLYLMTTLLCFIAGRLLICNGPARILCFWLFHFDDAD